jgi:hypothetical protein
VSKDRKKRNLLAFGVFNLRLCVFRQLGTSSQAAGVPGLMLFAPEDEGGTPTTTVGFFVVRVEVAFFSSFWTFFAGTARRVRGGFQPLCARKRGEKRREGRAGKAG